MKFTSAIAVLVLVSADAQNLRRNTKSGKATKAPKCAKSYTESHGGEFDK